MSNSRIDVKVTTDTGNYWCTGINATFAEACHYFMHSYFEDMGNVVSVELLTESPTTTN